MGDPRSPIARHLRDVHGLTEELIDEDDIPRMILDHVDLHGEIVNEYGWFRWPENAG